MTSKTLIHGGWVLTLGAKTQNLEMGDVLIDDGRIIEIGPGLRSRDADIVDATDSIVMPGFVDTHRHVWQALFRNMVGGPSDGELAAHLSPQDLYAATLLGLLGAAEAGITTVVDWCDAAPTGSHVEAVAQAHADAGLRTVLVGVDITATDGLEKLDASLNTIAFGSDMPAHDFERAVGEWSQARASGWRIHTHVGIEPSESGLAARMGGRGMLGPDVTLVHCTRLGEADFDAIASSATPVSLTPVAEMSAGLGAPPLQALIDRHIRPGLGVESEKHSPGDIFAQMRAANSIQHATLFDLKLAGKGGIPNLLNTRDVIKYATVDGARAVGLGEVTGSLEPGKRADVIVLRTDRPNIYPINDPIGAVVWGVDSSNLDWVFVDGRVVMRDGRLVADTGGARGLAEDAIRRVGESAQLFAGTGASR